MKKYQNITTLYVSQKNGNNSYDGKSMNITKDSGPFFTIEKALDVIRDLRKSGSGQPVTIKITDDVYNVSSPVIIDETISTVTIEPFDKTLICGGIEVSNFTSAVFNGTDCFCADLSEYENLEFTDFYVNGRAASLPCYPREGTLEAKEVEVSSPELYDGSKWFKAKREDNEKFKTFSDMENAIISFNHWWIDEHTPVELYDSESGKIVFKYPSRFTVDMSLPHARLEYIVENVARMFSEPGQWYYDRAEKKLYYILREDEYVQNISGFIPIADKIFTVKGAHDKKVKDICIRNFDIAYTKGDYKSECDDVKGYGVYASDVQAVYNAHGGIEFENAYNCSMENCRLFCFGVHCINIKEGCAHISIYNNEISDIGGGGISVAGGVYGSAPETHTCRNTISKNKILRCGNRYFSSCGILMRDTYENIVSHNEIAYVYYTGISCGWVWGYYNSITHHNKITHNHIHHLGLGRLSDMGGVYLLGPQEGTVVANNHIHDIISKNYGGWAIYTDEGSSYILVENNLCYKTSDSVYHQHYGKMNTVRNNIFAFGGMYGVMYSKREPHTGIILENNIIVTDNTPAYCIGYSVDTEKGTLKESEAGSISEIVSANNIIYDVSGDAYGTLTVEKLYTVEELDSIWRIDKGSVVADPGFKDLNDFDFTLKDDSPAFGLGFKTIEIMYNV